MILLINTAISEEVFIGLVENGVSIDSIKLTGEKRQADRLLSLLDRVLKKNKLKLTNLMGIAVVKGPGSFTSLRIGVVVANTLAWSLKVPIIGVTASDFDSASKLVKIEGKLKSARGKTPKIIDPKYGAEPNITLKK